MNKKPAKKKAKRRLLTARRRELINDLAVAEGIACCVHWGMGPKWYPKAIANIEEALIKQFREGKL